MLKKMESNLIRKNLKVVILSIFLLSTILNVLALDKVNDFSLENMKGKKMKLSDFQKDGLVIIDFWATWCSPCKKALPKLNKIHNNYKDVTVLTICTDKPRKKENAKAFVKSNRYNFSVLFDTNRDLQKKMNVNSIPRTIIVDQKGKVLYDHAGYNLGDEKHYIEVIEKWRATKKIKSKSEIMIDKKKQIGMKKEELKKTKETKQKSNIKHINKKQIGMKKDELGAMKSLSKKDNKIVSHLHHLSGTTLAYWKTPNSMGGAGKDLLNLTTPKLIKYLGASMISTDEAIYSISIKKNIVMFKSKLKKSVSKHAPILKVEMKTGEINVTTDGTIPNDPKPKIKKIGKSPSRVVPNTPNKVKNKNSNSGK
ncbi:MAG: TlpA family protein disulfide reductase [Candidatus Cloacimonetes bacterium]|nr:TlpA family protein disulfide reductase [Candidatus Cloacimonadota bacterium]